MVSNERRAHPQPKGLGHLVALLLGRRVAVHGRSMEPTLLPGERVLVNRRAYRHAGPARGEVVLALDPRDGKTEWVKRVAALPGDSVRHSSEGLWVNDAQVLAFGATALDSPPSPRSVRLGPDEYFLVGDAAESHPAASTDSRETGPVPRRSIRGRVWLVYWPPQRTRRVD